MKLATSIALSLAAALTLTACVTRETQTIVNDYCLIHRPIAYAVLPRVEREAAEREGRPVRDDGNLADTEQTQLALGEDWRVYRTTCGGGNVRD